MKAYYLHWTIQNISYNTIISQNIIPKVKSQTDYKHNCNYNSCFSKFCGSFVYYTLLLKSDWFFRLFIVNITIPEQKENNCGTT